MKKIVMILSTMFFVTVSSAQSGFGILGGVNRSTSSTKDIKWRTGGQLGVFYDSQIRDWFYLQPRLLMGYQENEYAPFDKSHTMDPEVSSIFYSQFNLQLPVLASFRLALGHDADLRLNVGPYFQYAIFGQDSHPTSSAGGQGVYTGSRRGWWHAEFGDKFTVGGQVGVQFSYKHLMLSVDYKHSYRRSALYYEGFENTLMMGLGYKF